MAARVLVGIAGTSPGVGKSTLAGLLRTRYGFGVVSIGQAVKDQVAAMVAVHEIAYDEDEKEQFRPLLSAWTEFRLARDGEDYWTSLALEGAENMGDRVLIPDIRYPIEADLVVGAGGLLVQLDRPTGPRTPSLASERALDKYPFQNVVANDKDDAGEAMLSTVLALVGSELGITLTSVRAAGSSRRRP